MNRESLQSTGGEEMAFPHLRVHERIEPVIVLGTSGGDRFSQPRQETGSSYLFHSFFRGKPVFHTPVNVQDNKEGQKKESGTFS
jgi:hypothetical protein